MCLKIQEQTSSEGNVCADTDIIHEACFAKNALLTVGNVTPYKAVLGQAPNLLQDFELPTVTQREDTMHLDRARLREVPCR